MFVTGPDVVKTVTKEEVTKEELGGSRMHSSVSGVCHKSFQNDIAAIAGTRNLLTYLPQSCREKRPDRPWTDFDRKSQSSCQVLNNIVPFDPNKPYDMKIVLDSVCDRN